MRTYTTVDQFPHRMINTVKTRLRMSVPHRTLPAQVPRLHIRQQQQQQQQRGFGSAHIPTQNNCLAVDGAPNDRDAGYHFSRTPAGPAGLTSESAFDGFGRTPPTRPRFGATHQRAQGGIRDRDRNRDRNHRHSHNRRGGSNNSTSLHRHGNQHWNQHILPQTPSHPHHIDGHWHAQPNHHRGGGDSYRPQYQQHQGYQQYHPSDIANTPHSRVLQPGLQNRQDKYSALPPPLHSQQTGPSFHRQLNADFSNKRSTVTAKSGYDSYRPENKRFAHREARQFRCPPNSMNSPSSADETFVGAVSDLQLNAGPGVDPDSRSGPGSGPGPASGARNPPSRLAFSYLPPAPPRDRKPKSEPKKDILPKPKPTEQYLKKAAEEPRKLPPGPDGKIRPKPMLAILDLNGALVYRVNKNACRLVFRSHLPDFLRAMSGGGAGGPDEREGDVVVAEAARETRLSSNNEAAVLSLLAGNRDLDGTAPATAANLSTAPLSHLDLKVIVWSSAWMKNVSIMVNRAFSPAERAKLVAVWSRENLRLGPFGKENVQVYKQLSWLWESEEIQASHPDAAGVMGKIAETTRTHKKNDDASEIAGCQDEPGKMESVEDDGRSRDGNQHQTESTVAPDPSFVLPSAGARELPRFWDQTNTILIDDSVLKGMAEPYNTIVIPEFNGDVKADVAENGTVLLDLLGYIRTAAEYENVSAFIRCFPFQQDEWKRLRVEA